MRIITVKEKKEEKFLRRETSFFDFKKHKKTEINELIRTMKTAMEKAEGIGLSANQINLDMRVFVAKVENKFYAIFNPQIVKKSVSEIVAEEGCLSVPQLYGEVFRPERITISGYDKNAKKLKIKAWGLLARVFQHEIDHLDGKLFIDRVEK
ncbi:MAG: peptide deformylase [Candidatus Colwellbacteria bacterium RIFCSPHIGHO2_12_FULL_43_12]|uniref:Peptide deformylase n=2 Tax=Candidatus Colwelliibacteriota TaxID=1817904 RepID=A0A1G1Z4Q2_9BACT|nr:MAG: peptide deformylase [Candidatus Colwellbacteria bacterium RIFCSPHIGHO2_12_FULL_43_12]OGY60974.1 MAG: peptide deformylase [Candidatus Colwellbacteria bacterium RIFCSPLOWO2_12_FULL_43_11]